MTKTTPYGKTCTECGEDMRIVPASYELQYSEAVCDSCGHSEVLD